MKFRYLVVFLETGEAPTGTNDPVLAQRIADVEEQAWVIDTVDGLIVESDGDTEEVEAVDPADWDEPEEEDSEDEDEGLDPEEDNKG